MRLSGSSWRDLLAKYPNAHLLQSAEWGDLKAGFGWQVERLSDGKGAAQVLFRPIGLGFSFGYIPRGPLGDPGPDFWGELQALGAAHRALFVKVEPDAFESPASQILNWPGHWVEARPVQPRRTILVDLCGEENAVLGKMKQKTRYNISLASRKGIEVIPSQDVTGFYRMMTVTGTRDGFGIHSPDYYQRAFDLFSRDGRCVLLVARYEKVDLAALMLFRSGKRCWYFYGASTDLERNRMPVYLLQWEAMRWARAHGCTLYDLWGIPDYPEELLERDFAQRSDGLWGVYRFKRGFGGEVRRSAPAWDLVLRPLLYSLFLRVLAFRRGAADAA